MEEKFVPIITQFGELKGRDCIFIDQVIFDDSSYLTFKGSLNAELIDQKSENQYPLFTLTFNKVIYYSSTEIDTYHGLKGNNFFKSSFDEIINSEFLRNFPLRVDCKKSDYRHFLVLTYDYVFEVLATDFVLQ